MNDRINLATRDGVLPAALYCTFVTNIAGEPFSFAVHQHLSCNSHVKLSELQTGMGIAEIPFPNLAPSEGPQVANADLIARGEGALARLIEDKGETAVAHTLIRNRENAQIINDIGSPH